MIETEGEAATAPAEEPLADGMAEVPEALEDVVPTTDVTAEERRTTLERRVEDLPTEPDRREGEWRKPEEIKVHASPAVRQRARDLGIDLAGVKFAGDRVRHADLDAYLLYSGGGGSGRGAAPARTRRSRSSA